MLKFQFDDAFSHTICDTTDVKAYSQEFLKTFSIIKASIKLGACFKFPPAKVATAIILLSGYAQIESGGLLTSARAGTLVIHTPGTQMQIFNHHSSEVRVIAVKVC